MATKITMIMNMSVKEFLQKKQEEEVAVLTREKKKLLKKLGLFDKDNKVVVDREAGYDTYEYDQESGEYIFYKVYPEITDEEYYSLLKYDKPQEEEQEQESNGEMGLIVIAGIELGCCVLLGVVGILVSSSFGIGGGISILGGILLIMVGLIQYWLVKVFTNISRKTTAIYELLKEKA